MPKLKILHLTTSLKMGGAETILYDLLRNMDSSLYENQVIYFYEGPFVSKIQSLGIKTYKIKGLICKYDPIFFIRLFFLVSKLKPDCMHSLLWSGNVAASLVSFIFKIPQAAALHLATNFEQEGKNNAFRSWFDKSVFKRPKKIIVVSQSMLHDIKHNSWFHANKIEIIKNCVDTKFLLNAANQALSKDLLNIQNCFVVGSVGRFIERKNHALLIDAFAAFSSQVSNSRLVLIGYGPLKDALVKKCQALNILDKVVFIEDNAYKYYRIFDCFVLTSLNESFGLVTLEAMCFNVPCIVTNKDKNHEIINDTNGILVAYDANLICQKIMDIYLNKGGVKDLLVKSAKETVNNFDVKIMVKQYCEVFERISGLRKDVGAKRT